jgi:hypothetical protein
MPSYSGAQRGVVRATPARLRKSGKGVVGRIEISAIAWVLFCGTAAADEVNLLANPDFSASSEISGWNNLTYSSENALTWANADAANEHDSGSAQLSNDQPYMTDGASATGQCFAVKPGASYRYGAKTQVVSGNVVAAMVCQSFSESTCQSDFVDLSPHAAPDYSAGWHDTSVASGQLDASASYVRCMLTIWNDGTGTAAMHFDDVYFFSELPDTVFSSHFEAAAENS